MLHLFLLSLFVLVRRKHLPL